LIKTTIKSYGCAHFLNILKNTTIKSYRCAHLYILLFKKSEKHTQNNKP